MANELRGLLYETITEVALLKVFEKNNCDKNIYWNIKPENMSINPDFTIGYDENNPTHVLLVTASGSTKNSTEKSWRNLGELFEVKAQLSNLPNVINIFYKSEIKKGLQAVALELYDATLHIDNMDYFIPLEQWVEGRISKSAKGNENRKELLINEIKVNSTLSKAIELLGEDIFNSLNKSNKDLNILWKLMIKDFSKPFKKRNIKHTSVRRGLAKLMIISSELRKLVYEDLNRKYSEHSLPFYNLELGFFSPTIGGYKLNDQEIKNVIELLGPEKCELIIGKVPDAVKRWIEPLRNLQNVQLQVDYIYNNYKLLTDKNSLKELLIKCYKDPGSLTNMPNANKVWLIEMMISLIKAKSGKMQGYGLSQLTIDTGIPEKGEGEKLLRFVFPKFVQRQELPDIKHMDCLARGISSRFKKDLLREEIILFRDSVKKWVIKENLEDRFIPYWQYQPLLELLYIELDQQNINYLPKNSYSGWIGEYLDIGKKTSTTPFVCVGTTFIHWKSVSDMGKVHKKKELAARVRNMKYQYYPDDGRFSRRNSAKQFVLIIDGTFSESDVNILLQSGWDRVIYPDEITEFVNSL